MKRSSILFILLTLTFTVGYSQTRLDIVSCLEKAVTNNLQLRQSSNQLEINEIAVIQQKFAFAPSVSAGVNIGKSFGTTVDNFTQQIATSPFTGSPNLGATLALFEGMSKWNNLRNREYSLSAAQYSLEDLKNDIRLNTATAFFQTLFSEDQIRLADERVALVEKQLIRMEAQVAAGTKTEGDLMAVKAQLATEKSAKVQQNSTFRKNLLNLIQVMNLDTKEPYELVRPNISEDLFKSELMSLDGIYAEALTNNPALRARAMEALARKYNMNSVKASYYPRVTLSYGLGSFYSSNNRPILRVEPGPNGTFVPVYGDPISLWNQLDNNFGQNVSLGLNVPIFSNYTVKSAVVNARVGYENAILQEEIERNGLYNSIQQAYLDVEAATAQLEANQEQLENVRIAYDYAQARFDAGMMDFFTLMDFLNNKTRAEVQQVQSQYDFLLKQKILELYQGKTLNF